MANDGVGLAQCNQLAIAVKQGVGAGQLLGGVDLHIVVIERYPGLCRAESSPGARVPLHRRAGVVAADGIEAAGELGGVQSRLAGAVVDGLHIAQLLWLPAAVGHAKLLPLIDEGSALHHVQHQGPLLGTQLAPLGAVVAEAGDGAGQVVVTQKQAVPALTVQSALVAGHGVFEGEGVKAGGPFIAPQPQVLEVEHHAELAVIRVRIVPHLGQICPPGLTDSDDPLAAEAGAIKLADIVVQAGAVAHGKP
ncbi:hypothetical protein D3C84_718840 [compost metagenome]